MWPFYNWQVRASARNVSAANCLEVAVVRNLVTTVGLAILMLMIAGKPALAGEHQVWDEAHFLKLQTVDQVDKILGDIHAHFGKDLMIETFASIPDDLKPNLEKDGKDKFFEGWSVSEGQELQINGLLILITGVPPHIQITVGLDTRKKAFTLADRDQLLELLATSFRQKDFDGGILQAAQFVRDRMAKNLAGGAGAATQPTTAPTTQPIKNPENTVGLP
jgi:uncharacterized membrane protein YgcG